MTAPRAWASVSAFLMVMAAVFARRVWIGESGLLLAPAVLFALGAIGSGIVGLWEHFERDVGVFNDYRPRNR